MIITFPSSFQAEFQPMRGADIAAMANRPDASSTDAIGEVLRGTWLKTIDQGPYDHGDGRPQFDKFLSGDLIYGLLSQVVASVPKGREYTFQVQCARKHQGRQFDRKIDLVADILESDSPQAPSANDNDAEEAIPEPAAKPRVRRLSDETVKHLLEIGNAFETTCAGRKVTYKLQSATDDKVARDLLKIAKQFGVKEITHAERLAVQCTAVEGVPRNSIASRYAFFRNASLPDLYALLAEVEAKDCGIDTEIACECPECGWENRVELPFGYLFSPRRD